MVTDLLRDVHLPFLGQKVNPLDWILGLQRKEAVYSGNAVPWK